MKKKIAIAYLVLFGIAIIAFVRYIIVKDLAFASFENDYSVTDLKSNFNSKKTEIYELKKYFNEIVQNNRFVEIEFENDNKLSRFGIKILNATAGDPNKPMTLEWDLDIHSPRIDSLIKPLGWTIETLQILKLKLDNANCIQIESGEPTKIGFKRVGMGMYTFNVFDNPIPDSLKSHYNDSCRYILANDRLVLEYAGGAIGGQCFYNTK